MSKRDQNKADNRLRLIHSASEAFAVQGVKGANINNISIGAGLGKGTVYNYFPSKRELFLAVLATAADELAAEIERDGANGLHRLISGLLSFYGRRPELAKLLIRTVADHEVEYQRAVMASFSPYLDRLQAAIKAGLDQGGYRTDLDPFLSAITLWGMINHQAAFHWLVSNRPLDPEAVAELVLTYFLNGVKRA